MSQTNQARLLSFSLDGWPVLGSQVTLSLVDGVAVLVGHNGAGKSAILEGFVNIAARALGHNDKIVREGESSIPRILEITALTPTGRQLQYKYEIVKGCDYYSDQCYYRDNDEDYLWKTTQGILEINGFPILPGRIDTLGIVDEPHNRHFPPYPEEMKWLNTILKGIHLLKMDKIYPISRRESTILQVSGSGIRTSHVSLANNLAQKVFYCKQRGELEELKLICQRIGLGSEIKVKKFISSDEDSDIDEEYIVKVFLDNVDFGLLSDGTLRILSIIVEIINLSPSSTLIIEEPEMQLHPGLLSKLLHEINAYTIDENLIISTHSPQVVTETDPDKINFVYRESGKTFVRIFDEGEISEIVDYLYEEGNLGEWIYSGILDE